MNTSDLRVFEAVARLGSMSRAGDELHTVQSNVTARVRALEEEIGLSLFERTSKGALLTEAGRRLLPFAKDLLRLLEQARRAARDEGSPSGQLLIGALETTAAIRLSPILARFSARFPEVDLTLRTGTTQELVHQVLEGVLEGAFVCGPVQHPELSSEPIFEEELVVLSAPNSVELGDLMLQPMTKLIVLRAGCSYRHKLEALITHRGVPNLRLLEFGTVESILASVAAGLGITMLPRSLVTAVGAGNRVRIWELPEAESLVSTMFVARKDRPLTSAASAFLETSRTS